MKTGIKIVTKIEIIHPKNRTHTDIWNQKVRAWYLKRDTRQALMSTGFSTKTHQVEMTLNGQPVELVSVNTDGMALFRKVSR